MHIWALREHLQPRHLPGNTREKTSTWNKNKKAFLSLENDAAGPFCRQGALEALAATPSAAPVLQPDTLHVLFAYEAHVPCQIPHCPGLIHLLQASIYLQALYLAYPLHSVAAQLPCKGTVNRRS